MHHEPRQPTVISMTYDGNLNASHLSTKARRSKKNAHNKLVNEASPRNHLQSSPSLLLPQDTKTRNSRRFTERMQDSRIKGSDLYVARLCWRTGDGDTSAYAQETADGGARTDMPNLTNGEAIPKHPNHVKIPTGSLHDELRFQSPPKASITKPPSPPTPKKMPTAT